MKKVYFGVLLLFLVIEFLFSVFVLREDVSSYPMSLPLLYFLNIICVYPTKGVILGAISGLYNDKFRFKLIRLLISLIILLIFSFIQILIVSNCNNIIKMDFSISFIVTMVSSFFQCVVVCFFSFIKYVINSSKENSKNEKVRGTEI